jgi:hypothetical protein
MPRDYKVYLEDIIQNKLAALEEQIQAMVKTGG